MIQSTFAFALLIVGLVAVALQRLYSVIPAHELKRLAARHDQLAMQLYRAVAYGRSLRLGLWILAGTCLAGALVLVALALPPFAAFVAAAAVLGLVFIGLLPLRLTVRSASFAAALAPALAWILHYIHPLLNHIAGLTRSRVDTVHSRLYEKNDLTVLLARQKEQPDNRIDPDELSLAERALQFSEKQAADVLTPRAYIRAVDAGESIGPILLGELHESGQSSFIVYRDQPENAVGTLLMRDAVQAKHGGKVADLMRGDVTYVHEDFTLNQVLDTFLKTKQNLVVVINSFEEMVGVITLDTLMHELFGEQGSSVASGSDDRMQVAAYKAVSQPQVQEAPVANLASASQEASSSDAPEVVQ